MHNNLFFNVALPGCVVCDGYVYTAESPIATKAGRATGDALIKFEDGLEFALSKSSSTKELSSYSLHGRHKELLREAYCTAMQDEPNTADFSMQDVVSFAEQIKIICQCWYSHFMHVDTLPDAVNAKYNEIFGRFLNVTAARESSKTRSSKFLKPITELQELCEEENPIKTHEEEMTIDPDMQALGRELVASRRLKDCMAKGLLSLVRQSAQSFSQESILQGKRHRYLLPGADFLAKAISLVGNGKDVILYVPFDDTNTVIFMSPHRHDADNGRHGQFTLQIGKSAPRSYFPLLKSDRREVGLALNTLARLAYGEYIRTSGMRKSMVTKRVSFDELASLFPIRFKNGSMQLQKKGEQRIFSVQVNFPQYGIVDNFMPDNIFLMEGGFIEHQYEFKLDRAMNYICGLIHARNEQPYVYLTSTPGRVCGFSPLRSPSESPVDIRMSSLVWENFTAHFALMTDGLKANAGAYLSDRKREEYGKMRITVEGREFPRYLPRKEFDSFNASLPVNKRLYIGDGRAR